MSDPRSLRPAEEPPTITKLAANAAAMREEVNALQGRVLRLEAELATMRATVAALAGPAAVSMRTRVSKQPPAMGPPPLPLASVATAPPTSPSVTQRKASRKSIVDISEIAELVESVPPPPRPPRK